MSDSSNEQAPRSVDEIEAELEATRRELGETIDAIGQRLDVKGRITAQASALGTRVSASASTAVQQVKDTATDDDGNPDPAALAVAGAVVAVVVVALVVVVRRRR